MGGLGRLSLKNGRKEMLIESLFVTAVCVGITVCMVLLVTAFVIGEEI